MKREVSSLIELIKWIRSRLVPRNGEVEEITLPQVEQNMVYEAEEFIQLILNQKHESAVNSFKFSYEVMRVLDEVRSQIGLVYPADLKEID